MAQYFKAFSVLPLKIFGFAFKTLTTTIITFLFVASLMLNVVMLTLPIAASGVSAFFTALTGVPSVIVGLKNINNSNKGLQKKYDKLVSKNNSLRSKMESNKKKVGKLTDRIAQRTVRVSLKSVASAPVQAIPYAGSIAVVAITASELKDACDTMKDMNDLNRLMGNNVSEDQNTVCGQTVPPVEEMMENVMNAPKAAWDKMDEFEVDLPDWEDAGGKIKSLWNDKFIDKVMGLFSWKKEE